MQLGITAGMLRKVMKTQCFILEKCYIKVKDLVTKKAAINFKMTADKGKTEAMKLYAKITFF